MSIHPKPTPSARVQRLRRHQFLTLRQPRGLCLRAERGTLWVTIDGDSADIELEAGQSRQFTGPETVVVGALGGDAVFSTTPVSARSPRRGWREWLLGAPRPALPAADLAMAALR